MEKEEAIVGRIDVCQVESFYFYVFLVRYQCLMILLTETQGTVVLA